MHPAMLTLYLVAQGPLCSICLGFLALAQNSGRQAFLHLSYPLGQMEYVFICKPTVCHGYAHLTDSLPRGQGLIGSETASLPSVSLMCPTLPPA